MTNNYTRGEAAHNLRISLRKLDELIALGEIKVSRFGRRVVITGDAIERFIRSKETGRR